MRARPRAPYDEELFRRIGDGVGVSCADLWAKDAWCGYEIALAAGGMRADTSLPVFVEGGLTGLAVFTHRDASAPSSSGPAPRPAVAAQQRTPGHTL